MALNASQLQIRIDTLSAAIDAGVLKVRHGTDEVTYQSAAEMTRRLATLQAQLDGLNGTGRSRLNYLEQTSKGFGLQTPGIEDGTDDNGN